MFAKQSQSFLIVLIVISLAGAAGAARADTPLTQAFSYQGQLQSSGSPYTGTADLRFTLWPDSTVGSEIGLASIASNVTITSGIFTALVNVNGEFGATAFTGSQRWLKIGVRTPHDPTNTQPFTPLSPRQALTATPYALALGLPYLGAGSTPATALVQIENAGAGLAISGSSATGHAVYGRNGAGSGLTPLFGFGTGVWGDTDNGNGIAGTSGTGFGVYGAGAPISGLTPGGRTGVVGDSHDGVGVAGLSSTNLGVYGIHGVGSGVAAPASAGVLGESRGQAGVIGLSGTNTGMIGVSNSSHGVYGRNGAGSGLHPLFGYGTGVWGDTDNGNGLVGTSGTGFGIYGALAPVSGMNPPNGAAVVGDTQNGTGVIGMSSSGLGVEAISSTGNALYGLSGNASGLTNGFNGKSGVWGDGETGVLGTSNGGFGVMGVAKTAGAAAVVGIPEPQGVQSVFAGWFLGNVEVDGTLTKNAGSFKIDDPIDPANKFLSHSFVESPDMKNIYDGNVTTDEKGYATVTLPDWFEALNQDFRYQLTVIDDANSEDFVQAKVVKEIEHNQFTIRTSCPGAKVSWLVTGIRHDAYANAHRIPVEEEKPADERGLYVNPAEFGLPRERAISWRAVNEGMHGGGETPAHHTAPAVVTTVSLSR